MAEVLETETIPEMPRFKEAKQRVLKKLSKKANFEKETKECVKKFLIREDCGNGCFKRRNNKI